MRAGECAVERDRCHEHDDRHDRFTCVPTHCLALCAQQAELLVAWREVFELITVWRSIRHVDSLTRLLRLVSRQTTHLAPNYSEFRLRAASPDAMDFIVLEGVFETPLLDRALLADSLSRRGRAASLDKEDLRVSA